MRALLLASVVVALAACSPPTAGTSTEIIYAANYDLYIVTFENGEGAGSVLDGFHIQFGKGINCNGSSPTITNCIVEAGSSPPSYPPNMIGMGIRCESASPTITNCTITRNDRPSYGGSGGGIACLSNSSPLITGCTITRNVAGMGGGIYSSNSSPSIINCTITENGGGGIYCSGSPSPRIATTRSSDSTA